ncbi:hypothetical protein BTR14_19565 [Rhizobium rhizosphaerae]|uniref:Glycosyltransferase n=1 Tax=Xaviernesmea rhizosphaerae TaxID=1672749 RepID=A0ABX3P894_9HYPH|nr:glycosyltransferase family 4 protein [Xaviernesmea rhizosphaerae]OQP84369.1 hypothetical protein BTR14_19565 [Xaviernesmea rhizosphaerae]
MRLVVVSSLVPVRNPATGFDVANRALVDGLKALGHDVCVIGYLEPGQEPADGFDVDLLGHLQITNARVSAGQRLRWLMRALMRHTTVSSAKLLTVTPERFDAALRKLMPFDGLILNSVQLAGAFERVVAAYPSIYVAHNVEAASARENAQHAKGLVERLLFAREARHIHRLEQTLARRAAYVLAFVPQDLEAFGPEVAARSGVMPLVRHWQRPAPAREPAAYDLGLIGSWGWRPNRLGLDWFVRSVVPLLPREMEIAIAGVIDHPPESDHPGLRFLGRVQDATAFVRQARVVPLVARGGTGVQLKTIETFELGMPSVATPASLRGIAAVPENCVTAQTPEDFARALVAMVAAVRAGRQGVVAGGDFHDAQRAALVAALEQGLAVLAKAPVPAGAPQSRLPTRESPPLPAAAGKGALEPHILGKQ